MGLVHSWISARIRISKIAGGWVWGGGGEGKVGVGRGDER